ncbi:MAG: magnesium-translocating P-type ATPase [Candidatus Magasanikbacteria bacterium]|nr:magnesium-translocating P-type ATPase [Candidatus Magasanikbacteria bacterium]
MPYISNGGLTEKQAAHLLARYGHNQIIVKKKRSIPVIFFTYFKNPLVAILFFAAILSGLFGEMRSAILIITIILFSTVLNFYQEQKSSHEAERLQEKLALTALVRRDGVAKEIKVTQIVPGDIVIVSAGDIIPADGDIVVSNDLYINEASLTGESFPVEKVGPNDAKEQKQRTVFAGTTVISGSGELKITVTGAATAIGKIAERLQTASSPDAFELGVTSFGYLIVKVTIFIVLAVFLINTIKPLLLTGAIHRDDFIQSLLFALAIAVGLTPELLPMIMSINMAKGSLRMAKKGVIVKRLNAIPDFGSINILCTDKTGTLTEDKITLVKYLDVMGNADEQVLQTVYLNSALQTGLKNPLDAAILNFKHLTLRGYSKADEIPYDFRRKRLSVVAKKTGEYILVTKGQPEEVLKICTTYRLGSETKTLSAIFLKNFEKLHQELSVQGFRTLAVCSKAVTDRKHYSVSDESDMVLMGIIAFYDPPKHTAAATLVELQRYGVEVKIITGDNELVTKKICDELKLAVKGIVTGDQIDKLSLEALAQRAEGATIFARFSPEQKSRVIAALRSRQNVVGYLGDGINDAPSLKAADIGISVSNAVDVAKETADIILSHKSLRELTDGLVEGRRTFGNTLKYLMMGLSSNFGNMFSLIAAAVYVPFLPILPYQVLLNNALYDVSQTSLPSDNVDEEYLHRPKRWDMAFMRRFMIVFGLMSSIFDVLTFLVLFQGFGLAAPAFRTGWFLESIATQTLVIYSIRTRRFFLTSRPSRFLVMTTLVIVAVSFALPFTALGNYFGFVALPANVLAVILGIVAVYLVMVEVTKHLFYRWHTESAAVK